MSKPRVRFCWECGNKLWGNNYTEVEIDDETYILHKQCAKNRKESHLEFMERNEIEKLNRKLGEEYD